MASMDPAWIALGASLFAGAGLKLVDHWLNRNKVRLDDARQIRDELREEVASRREENLALEVQLAEWREKYYDLREKHLEFQRDSSALLSDIRSQIDREEKPKKRP